MRHPHSEDGGFALINVLVILLALSAVAVQLLEDASRSSESVRMSRSTDQLALLSQSGVAFAAQLLAQDMQTGGSDHRGETWALNGFRAETAGTTVVVTTRDLEANFNLNLLISRTPSAPEAALRALIDATGAAPELASTIVARYAAFQPGPTEGDSNSADQMYLHGDLTHPGSFAPLAEDGASALTDHIATLPRGRPVNANTATPVALAAVLGLDSSAAAALAALRDRSPFESTSDLAEALKAITGTEANVPAGLVGVSSNWFEVETEVTLEGLTYRVRTILYRDPSLDEVAVFRRQAEVTG